MYDEIEVGATFVFGEDGKQFWYSSGQGHETSVNKSTTDLARELEQFTETNGEKVARFCEAHTHNLAAMGAVDWFTDEELAKFREDNYGPSVPPSLQDVYVSSAAKIQHAVGDTPYFRAVFDAQGIWYSRVPYESDYDAFPGYRAELDHKREVMGQVFDRKNEFAGGIITEAFQGIEDDVLEQLVVQYGTDSDQESIASLKEHFPENVRDRLESVLRILLLRNDRSDYPLVSEILSSEADRSLYQTFLEADAVDKYNFYFNTLNNWVQASKDGQFDESLLPQIYEAFIRNGAFVRFVPYDQVPNEPPCAGPDYKAE